MRILIFRCLAYFILAFAALEIHSQPPSTKALEEGSVLLQNQDFESAVIKFRSILRTDTENDQARRGLAVALVGVEQFSEASRELAKILARTPQDRKVLELAARSFWLQRRFAEGESVMRRRVSLGDGSAATYALYGDFLDARKKTNDAILAYSKAVNLDPGSIDFRYALGSLYWKNHSFDDAEREFLEILRRVPNEPRASFNLGDIYLTKGDAQSSVTYLEIGVQSFPNEFDTRFALGKAYLALNQYEKAIQQFEAAIKLRPEMAEGFYQLGQALQKAGRHAEAKAAFETTRILHKKKRDGEAFLTGPGRVQ